MRTKIGVASGAIAAAGIILAVFANAAVITDTYDTSTAQWESMTFFLQPDGGVRGQIVAHMLKADGGIGRQGAVSADITGTMRTNVLNVANNHALPYWVGQQQ